MNLLIVIDLQEAFINENTKEAISKIEKLIETNAYDISIFNKFINSLNLYFLTTFCIISYPLGLVYL